MSAKIENKKNLQKEFDRQVERLIQVGYPKLAGMTLEKFVASLTPLRENIPSLEKVDDRRIPFIIVIKSSVVLPEKVMPLIKVKGVQGEVRMDPLTSKDFSTIKDLRIPESNAYLLIDIDTGQKTLNITPHDALGLMYKEKRLPLTIDEGVALVLQFPEVLIDKKKYNCFSVLGSRRGDQRVPALWISYKKPRLGWCWDNNPHTWLGSASCANRVGM